jgi:hypothetical protein
MDTKAYQKWIEQIDALSLRQRAEVQSIMAGRSAQGEVVAALEVRTVR